MKSNKRKIVEIFESIESFVISGITFVWDEGHQTTKKKEEGKWERAGDIKKKKEEKEGKCIWKKEYGRERRKKIWRRKKLSSYNTRRKNENAMRQNKTR